MKEKKAWLWEFSKKIVVAVAVAFFIVLIYVMAHVWFFPDSVATDTLMNDMSDIFKVTVVTYGVKAGVENAMRIKKYDREEESVSDL